VYLSKDKIEVYVDNFNGYYDEFSYFSVKTRTRYSDKTVKFNNAAVVLAVVLKNYLRNVVALVFKK
jgi:hypothetical protein